MVRRMDGVVLKLSILCLASRYFPCTSARHFYMPLMPVNSYDTSRCNITSTRLVSYREVQLNSISLRNQNQIEEKEFRFDMNHSSRERRAGPCRPWSSWWHWDHSKLTAYISISFFSGSLSYSACAFPVSTPKSSLALWIKFIASVLADFHIPIHDGSRRSETTVAVLWWYEAY